MTHDKCAYSLINITHRFTVQMAEAKESLYRRYTAGLGIQLNLYIALEGCLGQKRPALADSARCPCRKERIKHFL